MVCFPVFGKLIWFYFMLVLAEIAGHLCILILASKPILRKKGPDISKFWSAVLMIHPGLIISTPFNVSNWIPGNGHFRTL